MSRFPVGARSRGVSIRAAVLLGTALGSTLVVAPAARAQNIASNGTTDYSLTETGTRNGGPRTVDITTSGGNITLDLGQVNTVNNGNTQGAAIAATNTGPGNTSIRTTGATATGTGLTYAIDGRATSGTVTINNTGTVDASGNNADRAIFGLTDTGNINITSNVANGQTRGISTFGNGTTTINAGTTTANGTGLINAIVAQGNRVVLTTGTTSNTNTAGNQGTAIFVNTDAGGALVNAGTTSALGQNQSAIQVFSAGAVDVTSGTIRTTQNSDGLSIQSGTDIVVRSTTVTNEGANGGYGIVLGANRGGGGFNGGPDGFAYTSAAVTSGSVTTAGLNGYGIYATPNGGGSTTITSRDVTTTGGNATGIYVAPIGSGTASGAITVNSTGMLRTSGTTAGGIAVANTTGVVTVNNSGSIASTGVGINVRPISGSVAVTSNAITTTGDNVSGISVQSGMQTPTAANIAIVNNGALQTNGARATGIVVANGTGTVRITNNGSITTTGSASDGIAIIPTSNAAITIDGTGSINTIRTGVLVSVNNGQIAAPVSITTGAITTNGDLGTGVQVSQTNGAVSINTGSITAQGTNSFGVSATQLGGPVSVTTAGTVTSTQTGINVAQTAGATGAAFVQTDTVRSGSVGVSLVGGNGPATVTTRDVQGVNGAIFATAAGPVSVTSGVAKATTANATTINAISTAGAATVVATDTQSAGPRAIFARGQNDASVTSTTLVANGTGGTALVANTATAAQGGNAAGTVTVKSGTLTSGATGINAYGPRATVNVDSMTLTAGNANAIEAYGLDVTVNSGSITTNGSGINAGNANEATRAANTKITSGTITMNGTDAGTSAGLFANGQSVMVDSGTITATGTGNRVGINAIIGAQTGNGNDGTLTGPLTVNSGSITTVGNGAYGIRAIGDAGLVTVNSTGTITTVGGTRQVANNVFRYSDGITATSFNGSATVTSNNISTSGDQAVGIRVEAGSGVTQNTAATNPVAGVVTVNSTGAIQTAGTNAAGISVRAGAGTVNIANTGSIKTSNTNSYGITVVPTSGATTITGTGSITTSGAGAHGIYFNPAAGTNTGAIAVTAGPIAVSAADAIGIYAINAGGPVTINASDVRATGANGAAIVIQPTSGSTAPINVAAGIVRSGGAAAAINLSSNGIAGPITASVVDSNSVGAAIDARSVGAVTLTGGTVQTTGANATGVTAISTGGVATVNSTNLTSANRGIYAQGLDSVSVTSGTLVSRNADFAIIARTSAANNNDPVVGTAAGIVNVTSTNLTATNVGINAYGPRATVNVTSGTVTTQAGDAIQAFGIDTNVKSDTITTGAFGINATIANGAATGGVKTIDSGSINLTSTAGTTAGGITTVGSSVVVKSGTITATGSGNRFGISAQVPTSSTAGQTEPGTVTVTSGSITTVGNGGYGIQAISDAGALKVTSTGTITTVGGTRMAGNQPRYSAGIVAYSPAGSITIESNTISTQGAQADGVRVEAGTGVQNTFTVSPNAGAAPISVTTRGTTQTAGANAHGIDIFGGGGAVTIANSGTITTGGDGSYGIRVAPGTGSTAIASNAVNTAGVGAIGIGTIGTTGAIGIASTNVATTGANGGAILARATTGAITIQSGTVTTSGVGAQGIYAETTDGNITINATDTRTAATGVNGTATSDAIIGFASGAGAVSVVSGNAATNGDNANAILAVGTGATNVTAGSTSTTGAQVSSIFARSRAADVTIKAGTTTATGQNAYAIEGHANVGNLSIVSDTASAALGNAIFGDAGGQVNVQATTANAAGDGGAGVSVTGGTGVTLNVGSASSTGTIATNAGTGQVFRADAIFAQATNGAINATVGNASAQGANADGVHLIANGTDGVVTLRVNGTVSSAGGYGVFIDPPGPVAITVASGARVSGQLAGIDTVGGSNAITNLGTITGTGGAGIVAAGPTTLDNGGTIGGSGGTAVQLSASNDSVILRTGSAVTGAIVGGGGTDSATLIGSGTTAVASQTVAAFTGFDSLTVQSGYWTAPAATSSTVTNTRIASGASLELVSVGNGTGYQTATIADDGQLVVRSSTFGATTVTGAGTTRFTGADTTTLAGTNSFQNTGTNTVDQGAAVLLTGTQGGTFVNNGTFTIGTGGTTGNFTGNLTDNGTLVINRSDTYAFDGALTGAGLFVKQGAGQVVFGPGYAFTGTTQLNGGSIKLVTPVAANTELDVRGTGTVDLSGQTNAVAELMGSAGGTLSIAGGSLTDNQSTSTTFAGVIAGAGGMFTKAGTGTLNLTGANTYTGATTINGGTLAVNGSITSPVTVASGGTLGGTGTIGGNVTIGSGGTYAPGNSIGTQTVNGNVTFAAGSTFAVEVNAAGAADRIVASGTATLNGGTVAVNAGAGTYGQLTTYNILTANGGVTGRFANVTSNMAFLSPLLSYASNGVNLTLARNDVSFGSMATNSNQAAVAGAIAGRTLGDPIYNAILFQSAAAAPGSFEQLSGELQASVPSVLVDGGRRVRDTILDRGTTREPGVGIWLDGVQTFARSRNQGAIAQARTNRSGVYGGVDYENGNLRFGLNGGYFDQKITVPGRAGRADVDTKLVGGSIAYVPAGRLSAQAGLTYAWHDIDSSRAVSVTGLAATLTADYKGHSTEAFGEVGYALTNGPVTVSPYVRYTRDWTSVGRITEMGGAAALRFGRDKRDLDFGAVGLRVGGALPVSASLHLEPKATVAYEHAWGDRDGARGAAFTTGTGPGFAVSGVELGRNTVDADVGADLVSRAGFRIGVGGFTARSKQWRDYGGKVSVGFRF